MHENHKFDQGDLLKIHDMSSDSSRYHIDDMSHIICVSVKIQSQCIRKIPSEGA